MKGQVANVIDPFYTNQPAFARLPAGTRMPAGVSNLLWTFPATFPLVGIECAADAGNPVRPLLLQERIHIVPGQKLAFVHNIHISYFIPFSRKILWPPPIHLTCGNKFLKDCDNGRHSSFSPPINSPIVSTHANTQSPSVRLALTKGVKRPKIC